MNEPLMTFIPGSDVLHRMVEVYFSADIGEEASVLLIGEGSNAQKPSLNERHPQWSLTATENAAEFQAIAETEPFQAATLMMVLHRVPDSGEKLQVLCDVADRLAPGAPLFLSTYVGDPTATRTKKLFDLTKRWATSCGMSESDASEHFRCDNPELHLVPEERLKALLREAGYIDVQRMYQGLLVGAWIARTQRG